MTANIDQLAPTKSLIDLSSHSDNDFGLANFDLCTLFDDLLLATYVDDLADACLFSISNFQDAELVNIGSGENIKIKDLAESISEITGYKGSISWDKTKPNGTPDRPLDCSRISSLGWRPKYTLQKGLEESYEWFKGNYKHR